RQGRREPSEGSVSDALHKELVAAATRDAREAQARDSAMADALRRAKAIHQAAEERFDYRSVGEVLGVLGWVIPGLSSASEHLRDVGDTPEETAQRILKLRAGEEFHPLLNPLSKDDPAFARWLEGKFRALVLDPVPPALQVAGLGTALLSGVRRGVTALLRKQNPSALAAGLREAAEVSR